MINKRYLWLAVIALAAAGLRAAYACLPRPEGDGGLYLLLAGKILAGEYFFSFSGDSFPLLYRTPVYPAFLALASFLPGSVEAAAAAVQRLLGLLTVCLVYRIALPAWGSRAAAAGGALFAAAHFHFLYFEAYPLSETLAVFLACAAVYYALALRSAGRPAARDLGLGGLLAGCAAMCRPELFLAAALCAWYVRGEGALLSKVRRAALYLAPALLLAAGWTLRNGLLHDYWGLTPNSAITLFSGPAGRSLQPEDVGADFIGVQALKYRESQGLGNRAVSALEKEGIPYQWAAARMGRLAAGAALSRPGAYLRGSLRQLKELLFPRGEWPPSDITETMPDLFAPPLAETRTGKILSALGRADWFLERFLLPWLFLAGAILSFRRGGSGAGRLLAALPLGLLLIYAFLSPVSARYRVIAEPFMGLLAARAAQLLYLKLRGGAPPPAAAQPGRLLPAKFTLTVLAAAGCLFVFFLTGVSRAYLERSRALPPAASAAGEGPARPGYLALRQGRYPQALKLFDKALAGGRDKAAADGRAEALFRMGRGREALAELEATLLLNPGSADTLYNIGRLNYLSGENEAAVINLSGFMKLPGSPHEPRLRAAAMLAELRGAK
ncbi:MAG TPA: hypothetical protein DEQ38_07075 [Elusimicrobia bacterium]|nr:MAG: hypothetical protein A2089_07940 [Elusimicrobia bacterium GWD2_63_28]HCC47862.1 hypothetical protein [Elusimicrobiota bacterium]